MDRRELVRRWVLNSICDDFENIDQMILRNVAESGSQRGMTIERSEIVEALTSLVAGGLAKAYLLPVQDALPGMPNVDAIEKDYKTYFYITKRGMAVHLAGGDA